MSATFLRRVANSRVTHDTKMRGFNMGPAPGCRLKLLRNLPDYSTRTGNLRYDCARWSRRVVACPDSSKKMSGTRGRPAGTVSSAPFGRSCVMRAAVSFFPRAACRLRT
jgi:hypothetical protein